MTRFNTSSISYQKQLERQLPYKNVPVSRKHLPNESLSCILHLGLLHDSNVTQIAFEKALTIRSVLVQEYITKNFHAGVRNNGKDNIPVLLEYWMEGSGYVSYQGEYRFRVQSNSQWVRTILQLNPTFHTSKVLIRFLKSYDPGIECKKVGLVGCIHVKVHAQRKNQVRNAATTVERSSLAFSRGGRGEGAKPVFSRTHSSSDSGSSGGGRSDLDHRDPYDRTSQPRETVPRRKFTSQIWRRQSEGINSGFMTGSIGALLTIFLILMSMLFLICYRDYRKRTQSGDFYRKQVRNLRISKFKSSFSLMCIVFLIAFYLGVRVY